MGNSGKRSRTPKPPAGSRPGTLAISDEAVNSVLSVISYDESVIDESDRVGIDDLKEILKGGRKLWVDVQGLGDERLVRELAELFAIHPLALEDLVHVPGRPKTEVYEENLLVVSRMPSLDGGAGVDLEQVSMLIGKDYVLSFKERLSEALAPVRDRLQVDGSRIRKQSVPYCGQIPIKSATRCVSICGIPRITSCRLRKKWSKLES